MGQSNVISVKCIDPALTKTRRYVLFDCLYSFFLHIEVNAKSC